MSDLTERLRERYTAAEVPLCPVCGGALSIQSAGGGAATVYGCNNGPFDMEHYQQSRFTQYRPGDLSVIEAADTIDQQALVISELVEALEAVADDIDQEAKYASRSGQMARLEEIAKRCRSKAKREPDK